MTIELHLLRALWLGIEAAGAHGVALTFPDDFLPFPYQEGSLQWKNLRRTGNPKTAKLLLDGHDQHVLMQKRCTSSFATALHSHGVDMAGVAAAPSEASWALGLLLKTTMGGLAARASGGATTVQAGSTTTVVNVTAGRGGDFFADGVLACQTVSGSSALEARPIQSISTDAITVKEAFSATPVTGTSARGGVTVYPTEDPSTSVQAVIEGNEQDDRVVHYGLQGGHKINVPVGAPDGDGEVQLPTMSFDLMGGGWARGTPGAPQTVSYSMYEPIANVASELTTPAFGVSTRVHVDDAAFALEVAIAYKAITTGLASGLADNVLRQRRQASRPLVKGNFLTVFESTAWESIRDARTPTSIYKQIGNLAGGGMLIDVPRAQITDVQPADNNGATGQLVSFEGRHDDGSTELGRAALRYHFF